MDRTVVRTVTGAIVSVNPANSPVVIPIKVFHFVLDPRTGGPHVYVQSLAKTLNAHVSSVLVTAGRGETTQMALTNLRHLVRGLYPLEVAWNVLRLCWSFRRRESRRSCVFDVHGAVNLAPMIAARVLRIPVVWHFHETLKRFRTFARFGRAILAGSPHKVVVVARKSADVFEIPDAELIPGVIDADFWRLAEAERKARRREAPLRLVTVGNLNPLKGTDLLLDVLAEFNRPWELVVVGSPLATFRDYGERLRAEGRRITGTRSKVQFVGWQAPESVRSLLAHADVFVLPSRSEACPLALLEAMAMECVCVATDVGDVREILNSPELGIVAAADSKGELLAALEQVGGMTPTGRSEMGARAREKVVARYAPDRIGERHLQLYKTLVSESARS